MKKQIIHTILNPGLYKTLLIAALALGPGFHANASKPDTLVKKATIVYEGKNNNLLVFDIQYTNPDSSNFAMELTDENGEVLFLKNYSDANFNRKIYIDKGPADCKINFLIRGKKINYKETFSLQTTEKTVNNFVISKL
jgi:hypothetical protein